MDDAKEVSSLVIGYKFALGITEIILGLGIGFFDKRAIVAYQNLRDSEFLEDSNNLLLNLVDKSIPYITAHKVIIVSILLLIGIIKIISCLAIWAGKNWGVHLLLGLMLVLLPFDLFDFFRSLIISHLNYGSLLLNALNIWIILSLVHYQPIKYFKLLYNSQRAKHRRSRK